MDVIGPSPATPQGRRSANYAVLLAKLEASCRVADPRCSPLTQPDLGRDATASCHDPTAQRSGRRGSPVLSDSAASSVSPGGAAGPSASCASSATTISSPSPPCLSLASYAPHLSKLFTGRVHASASQHVDCTTSGAQRRPLSPPSPPPPLFEVRVHRHHRHRAERATHRHGHSHAAPSAPPAESCAMATPHCARRRATLPERQPTPSTAEYYHRFLTAYRRSPAAAASSTLGLLRPCVVVASEAEDETLDGSVLVEGGGGSSAPPPPPVACLTTPCCSPIPTMGSDAEAVLDTSPSAPAEVACRLFSSISSSVNEGLH